MQFFSFYENFTNIVLCSLCFFEKNITEANIGYIFDIYKNYKILYLEKNSFIRAQTGLIVICKFNYIHFAVYRQRYIVYK